MSDDQARQIFDLLRKQSEQLAAIDKRLFGVETEMRLRPICPSPGLCSKLEPKVNEHEQVLQRAKGGWWVITVIPTLSSIAGFLLAWYYTKK